MVGAAIDDYFASSANYLISEGAAGYELHISGPKGDYPDEMSG